MNTHGLRFAHPSSLLLLRLGQEVSGNLVDNNERTESRTVYHLQSALPDIYTHIQERRGSLRDRGILCESVIITQLPA